MALQEYYNTGANGALTIYGYAIRIRAQTFTAESSYSLGSVKLQMYRSGTPTGNVVVELKAVDGDGKPTGPVLSTGSIAKTSITEVNQLGEFQEIGMTSYAIVDTTQYALLVYSSNETTGAYWGADSSSPTYAGGMYVYSTDSGSTWTTNAGYDFMFEVYSSSAANYDEGTLSVSGDGSAAIVGEGWLYEEGALAVAGSGAVTLSVEHPGYAEGTLAVSGTGAVLLASETVAITETLAVAAAAVAAISSEVVAWAAETLAVSGSGSVAIYETGVGYNEGALAVSGTGAVGIAVETIGHSEVLQVSVTGAVLLASETVALTELLEVAAAVVADLSRQAYQDASGWPTLRISDYDPDLYWDEETATWSDTRVTAAGSRADYAIFIGEQGEIYYYEVV
jgi:hypothetical protein